MEFYGHCAVEDAMLFLKSSMLTRRLVGFAELIFVLFKETIVSENVFKLGPFS